MVPIDSCFVTIYDTIKFITFCNFHLYTRQVLVHEDMSILSEGESLCAELHAMKKLLPLYIKTLGSRSIHDSHSLVAMARKYNNINGKRDQSNLNSLIEKCKVLNQELDNLEAEKWQKIEEATHNLRTICKAAEVDKEIEPLLKGIQNAIRDGLGQTSAVVKEAKALELKLKERAELISKLQGLLDAGREKFGFDFDDPDEHEFADADEEDVVAMRTIANELIAMMTDLEQRPEPKPLNQWPNLAEISKQVNPTVAKLRSRCSVLNLRTMIDDAQLEETNPFEEKVVTSVKLERAAFEALDTGLDEESELYQTAGEIVQRLKQDAREYDQENFDVMPDDADILNDKEAEQPEEGTIETNVSYRVIRLRQRRASLTMAPEEVAKKWLRIKPSVHTEYFYNSITGASQDTHPSLAEVVCSSKAHLRTVDPFLFKVILLQNMIRSWLCRKRLDSVRVQKMLRDAILEARQTRDATKLLEAIHKALEQGLDDESDVYFEAGGLIEALEDDDTQQTVKARGGMEWTRMWDASSKKLQFYYLNVATLETRYTKPEDYIEELDKGIQSLPKRVQRLLTAQSAVRNALRKLRLAVVISRPTTAATAASQTSRPTTAVSMASLKE